MAKEFAIVTKPSGLTDVGTIKTFKETQRAEWHYGHDENGNVDAESHNRVEHVIDFELELDTRASISSCDVGDTITVVAPIAGSQSFTVRECAIAESNEGDPNLYTGQLSYHVPSE